MVKSIVVGLVMGVLGLCVLGTAEQTASASQVVAKEMSPNCYCCVVGWNGGCNQICCY